LAAGSGFGGSLATDEMVAGFRSGAIAFVAGFSITAAGRLATGANDGGQASVAADWFDGCGAQAATRLATGAEACRMNEPV